MNIGDRYYCIQNMCDRYGTLINENGKTYKVLTILENIIYLECDERQFNDHYFYSINEDKNYYNFYSYFTTIQKARIIKLKKLKKHAGKM